jgi:hypothetical protein
MIFSQKEQVLRACSFFMVLAETLAGIKPFSNFVIQSTFT